MKCKETQDRFSEYLDGALMLGELRDVEQHLAECAECAQEISLWKEAASALSGALSCDAMPRTSLEEFVVACTAGTDAPTAEASRFIRWLTSPRHALASTVAGSFALTALLLMLVWTAGNGIGSAHSEQSPAPTMFGQYENIMGLDNAPIERSLDNGTKEKRRSDRGRFDTCVAAYPHHTGGADRSVQDELCAVADS